jgi:hypothetical protein
MQVLKNPNGSNWLGHVEVYGLITWNGIWDVKWIAVSQEMVQWRVILKTEMDIRAPKDWESLAKLTMKFSE